LQLLDRDAIAPKAERRCGRIGAAHHQTAPAIRLMMQDFFQNLHKNNIPDAILKQNAL
jgi:hypothetical protein